MIMNEQIEIDDKYLHKNSFTNDYTCLFHEWMKHECKNSFMEDYQKVIFHEWMPYE